MMGGVDVDVDGTAWYWLVQMNYWLLQKECGDCNFKTVGMYRSMGGADVLCTEALVGEAIQCRSDAEKWLYAALAFFAVAFGCVRARH